ncbi:MAG: serine/threonine protein kinase [Lentisphaeraceae bacterium]|nr:serine/threonine protein kinase [Lentisphaeraceae bacterium]
MKNIKLISDLRQFYDESDVNEIEILSFLNDHKYRYADVDACGEGGMKKVVSAEDLYSGRLVAKGYLKDLAHCESFLREIRLLAKLEHPNIVPLYDVGMDDEEPFIVMRLFSGQNLEQILVSKEQKSTAELLDIFLKVCDAISFAHSKKIIHCDIKPDNIQVDSHGIIQVCDWGIACELDTDGRTIGLSKDKKCYGTPGYMAPEQITEKLGQLSTQTDVYALGALLYRMLTKELPISQASNKQMLQDTILGNIKPQMKYLGQRVPFALESVAYKALSVEPNGRYNSVSELSKEIRSYMAGFATQAEEADFLTQLLLLIKRNLKISIVLILSFILIATIISISFNRLEMSTNIALTAQREAEMARDDALTEKNAKLAVSKQASPRFIEDAWDSYYKYDFQSVNENLRIAFELNPQTRLGQQLKNRQILLNDAYPKSLKKFIQVESNTRLGRVCKKALEETFTQIEFIKELNEKFIYEVAAAFYFKIYKKKQVVDQVDILKKTFEPLGKAIKGKTPDFHYDQQLKQLTIKNTSLKNLTFFCGLEIEHLELIDCEVRDSLGLQFLKLTTLNLKGSYLKDLDHLVFNVSDSLNLRNTNIITHGFFKKHNVRMLDISECKVLHYAMISTMNKLKVLTISKDQVNKGLQRLRKDIQIIIRE